MTKLYKSARGKAVDIDKIKLANETTVAVGNMKVNARGDLIGQGGQIAMGRNQIMDKVYAVADEPGYSPNDASSFKQQQQMAANSNAQQLSELVNNLTVPITETETSESAPAPTAARGSLASSVAKTTTVTQELLPDPRKPKGPARI